MRTFKYFKFLLVIGLLAGLTGSCEGPDPEFFADESSEIILQDLPISLIVIDGENPNNPAVTFNWNNADYNQAVVENYAVEFSTSSDMANSIVATGSVGISSVTMSMSQLNSVVGEIGLDPLQEGSVFARIVGSLGVQEELPVTSNVISFEVVPFFNYSFKDIYLVGPACVSGWDNNNNNPPMFRDATNANAYSYTGFFNGGQPLKVIENRGSWAPQYGESSDGVLAFRPTEDDPDPAPINDIESLPSGYYTFQVDLSNLTFTISPFSESGSTTYASMTLQGDALEGDIAMTQSSFDPHYWIVNSVSLQPGSLQFSADNGTTWAGATEFSGVATQGGDSTPVIVQDEYEVWFNDLTGDYIMIPLTL
jgi:hypothetical protein